jgi:hypothetical protein
MLETFIITLYVTDFDKDTIIINWFLADIYKKKAIKIRATFETVVLYTL